jgi:hypothetical protein
MDHGRFIGVAEAGRTLYAYRWAFSSFALATILSSYFKCGQRTDALIHVNDAEVRFKTEKINP